MLPVAPTNRDGTTRDQSSPGFNKLRLTLLFHIYYQEYGICPWYQTWELTRSQSSRMFCSALRKWPPLRGRVSDLESSARSPLGPSTAG